MLKRYHLRIPQQVVAKILKGQAHKPRCSVVLVKTPVVSKDTQWSDSHITIKKPVRKWQKARQPGQMCTGKTYSSKTPSNKTSRDQMSSGQIPITNSHADRQAVAMK